MKTEYKSYHCPKCETIGPLQLFLARKGEHEGKYFYTCSESGCRFYLNTGLNTKHDFSNFNSGGDGIHCWECENDGLRKLWSEDLSLNCEDCINAIKINMLETLCHFIECGWSAHFMTMLNKIIIPY